MSILCDVKIRSPAQLIDHSEYGSSLLDRRMQSRANTTLCYSDPCLNKPTIFKNNHAEKAENEF